MYKRKNSENYHLISLVCDKETSKRGKKEANQKIDLTISKKLMTTRIEVGGWGHGLNKWWELRSALVLSTGCCMELYNHCCTPQTNIVYVN